MLPAAVPPLSSEEAVVLRLNLVDDAAHNGKLQLYNFTGVVSSLLQRHLPPSQEECMRFGRTRIFTYDHGCSWSKGSLRHGKDGIFEETVFRAEWRTVR